MALAFDWSIFIHRGTWRMFIYAQNDGREKSRRDTTTTSLLIIITHFAHVDHHMHLYNSSILSLSLFHSISLSFFLYLSVCLFIWKYLYVNILFLMFVCLSISFFHSISLCLFIHLIISVCQYFVSYVCLSCPSHSEIWSLTFSVTGYRTHGLTVQGFWGGLWDHLAIEQT